MLCEATVSKLFISTNAIFPNSAHLWNFAVPEFLLYFISISQDSLLNLTICGVFLKIKLHKIQVLMVAESFHWDN